MQKVKMSDKNSRAIFGETVRKARLEKKIGLRDFAEMVSLSPAYISQMEADICKPPKEENIKKIAELLGLDKDYLLALAGRVASDLQQIIIQYPSIMPNIIREYAKQLTETEYCNNFARNLLYVMHGHSLNIEQMEWILLQMQQVIRSNQGLTIIGLSTKEYVNLIDLRIIESWGLPIINLIAKAINKTYDDVWQMLKDKAITIDIVYQTIAENAAYYIQNADYLIEDDIINKVKEMFSCY